MPMFFKMLYNNDYCVFVRLQHSVSLAAHHSVGWRRASRAHWVSTSLGLAHARACPVLQKPPPLSEELWTLVSAEVSFIIQFSSITLSEVIEQGS